MKIISPCISICKTDPLTGFCYGCGRSINDKKMWKNPANKKNIEELKHRGIKIIGPIKGNLACGESGIGKMENIKIIKNIPTIIIQGRYDLICPPKSAFLLAKNMSNCELKIIENSGHSMSEPNIKSNVLKAIDEIFYKIKKK